MKQSSHRVERKAQCLGSEAAPPGTSGDCKETPFNQYQCPGPWGMRGRHIALYQLTCHFRLGGEALFLAWSREQKDH